MIGASSGIGQEVAKLLVEQGWTVEQFRAVFRISVLDSEELAEVERRRAPQKAESSFRLIEGAELPW